MKIVITSWNKVGTDEKCHVLSDPDQFGSYGDRNDLYHDVAMTIADQLEEGRDCNVRIFDHDE